MSEDKKKLITQEDIMKLLDSCYEKCLNGVPYVSPTVEEFAKDYLDKLVSKLQINGFENTPYSDKG